MLARHDPERLLNTALDAVATDPQRPASLDELPVPIYTTDASGKITYCNQACVEFTGREPELGRDRWCVTWELFTTTGDRLAPEECPMAQAIKQRKPVRDAIAIAERPDGSRRAFRPYPTPLFDDAGELTGAVNMLIDVTDEQSGALKEQAERCRRLADATYDRATSKVLAEMATRLERTAKDLAGKQSD